MATDSRRQPGYLTLTGLLVSYAVACGAGYLAGGAAGVWCASGLLTARYVWLIWRAAAAPANPDRQDKPSP